MKCRAYIHKVEFLKVSQPELTRTHLQENVYASVWVNARAHALVAVGAPWHVHM